MLPLLFYLSLSLKPSPLSSSLYPPPYVYFWLYFGQAFAAMYGN